MKDVDSKVISIVIRDEALRMDEFAKEENMEGKDLWEHQKSWGRGRIRRASKAGKE